jgi:hypothetical protein
MLLNQILQTDTVIWITVKRFILTVAHAYGAMPGKKMKSHGEKDQR